MPPGPAHWTFKLSWRFAKKSARHPPINGAIDEKNAVIIFFEERYTIASSLGASFKPIFVRERLMPDVATPVSILITASNPIFVYSFDDVPTKHHAIIQHIYKGAPIAIIVLLLKLSA